MRQRLLLLLTTLLVTACGGNTNAEVLIDERTVVNAPTASSSQTTDLAIDCRLNDTQRQVTCTAIGYVDGARLYWWTNSEKDEGAGETFDFIIANPRPDLTISFEECRSGSCQTVTTTLDTAHLMAPKPAGPSPAEAIAAASDRPEALTFVSSKAHSSFFNEIQTAFQSAVDAEFSAAPEKAGISVAVFTDGRLWTYASGIASSTERMTPNTPLRIWSASKIFLGALILHQIEQGLFELDDSLESVLSDHPDYPSINPLVYNPAVTIKEMLNMRSGIAHRDFENPPAGIYENIYSNPDWKPIDALGVSESPWVERGSFTYSNLNTILLGLVAEHHGGQDLNLLYRDVLFEPLSITVGLTPRDGVPVDAARPYQPLGPWGEHYGLNLSGFGDRIEAEIAAGWENDPRDWHIGQGRITWAAAGAFSTAENMARWGYELFSPNGSAISESNRTMLLSSFGTELIDLEGRMQYYGYHATKSNVILKGGRVVTAYGHPGGSTDWKGNYVSKLAYSPELDLSISVLTNSPLAKGTCPDHSSDQSQRFGNQLCIIQEIFEAYASGTQDGKSAATAQPDVGGKKSARPRTTAIAVTTAQAEPSERSAAELVRRWSQGGSQTQQCVGSGSSKLSAYPLSLDEINFIHPLGALNSNHITPTSHTLVVPKINIVADIRVPNDGFIVKMQDRGSSSGIRYIIEITCDFYVILDHVLDPPDSILTVIGDNAKSAASDTLFTRIPVSVGALLGRHPDGRYFDLTVVDLSRGETDGYVRNESYYSGETGEPSKLFERDQFEYFDEPLRSALMDKSLRTVAPRGGTFIYDIDGTAQGNWFRQGTRFLFPNWSTVNHLALVTDPIDPSQLRVSIGDGFNNDEPMGTQWGVTGDEPDFSEVTTASGSMAFELRKLNRCDRSAPPDSRLPEFYSQCSQQEAGTLLIQLLEDQRLRVEVFFDVSPASRPTFTENARVYVR